MGHNEMLLGEALRGHDGDLANGDDGCRPQLSGFLGFMAEIGQLSGFPGLLSICSGSDIQVWQYCKARANRIRCAAITFAGILRYVGSTTRLLVFISTLFCLPDCRWCPMHPPISSYVYQLPGWLYMKICVVPQAHIHSTGCNSANLAACARETSSGRTVFSVFIAIAFDYRITLILRQRSRLSPNTSQSRADPWMPPWPC
jgi:hypothetical protein